MEPLLIVGVDSTLVPTWLSPCPITLKYAVRRCRRLQHPTRECWTESLHSMSVNW